jgi:hypothetical protein
MHEGRRARATTGIPDQRQVSKAVVVRDMSLLKDDVITEGRSAPWGTLGLLEVDFPQLEWKNIICISRSKSGTYNP